MFTYTKEHYFASLGCAALVTLGTGITLIVCLFIAGSPVWDAFELPLETRWIVALNYFSTIVIVFLSVALLIIEMHGLRMQVEKIGLRLEELSNIDALTGLYNRRYLDGFVARLEHEKVPYSVLLLDIDHFKIINDRYGHAVGDEVLKALANAIRTVLRTSDCGCRWGGEEILVVLPQVSRNDAIGVAKRLLQKIRETSVSFGESEIHFTATIGVAQMRFEEPFEEVLHRADQNLYLGKDRGRDRYVAHEGNRH